AGQDGGQDHADQREDGRQHGEPLDGDRGTPDVETDSGGAARRRDDRGGDAGEGSGGDAGREQRTGRRAARGGGVGRGHDGSGGAATGPVPVSHRGYERERPRTTPP